MNEMLELIRSLITLLKSVLGFAGVVFCAMGLYAFRKNDPEKAKFYVLVAIYIELCLKA
jgi:hypothetical protein